MKIDDISNSKLSDLIDEWIKGERNRAILKRRLIDCICYEPLAEEFGEVVSGAKLDDVMNVLNEHMEVVKMLLPKEYNAVISRIKESPE